MGKLNIGMVRNVIMVVIVLIMIFYIIGDTSSDIGSSADNMSEWNATGYWINTTHCNDTGTAYVCGDASTVFPLTSFFKKKGVILLALIAGVVITVIAAVLPKGKK